MEKTGHTEKASKSFRSSLDKSEMVKGGENVKINLQEGLKSILEGGGR